MQAVEIVVKLRRNSTFAGFCAMVFSGFTMGLIVALQSRIFAWLEGDAGAFSDLFGGASMNTTMVDRKSVV